MKPNQPWYISHAETIAQNVIGQLLYSILMYACGVTMHTAIVLQLGGFGIGYARGYFIRRSFELYINDWINKKFK